METSSNPSEVNRAQIHPQGVVDLEGSDTDSNKIEDELQALRHNGRTSTKTHSQYIKDLEDLPFHEADYEQVSLVRKVTLVDMDKEEVQRYQAEWHWNQFVEFSIYHLVFYVLLGPFSNFIFCKKPGLIVMRNLYFIGNTLNFRLLTDTLNFRLQSLIWLNISFNTLYYFWQESNTVSLTEILFMWCAAIQRTVVICAKYATLSPERILLYKTENLSDEQRGQDMFVSIWRLQIPKIKSLEIYRSLRRHSLDINNFRFNFIVPVTDNTKTSIRATKLEVNNIITVTDQLTEDEFCGFQIIRYVVDKYQTMVDNGKTLFNISQYLSIILTMTPLVYNGPHIYYFYQDIQFGIIQTIRLVINVYMTYKLFFGSYVFLMLGIYDQRRKIYILTQCQYMLSTQKLQLDYPKLIPTIDIYNKRSLKAWAMMRTVGYDYGASYHLRSQGFFSFVFLTSTALFLTFIVVILDLHRFGDLELILICEMAVIIITHIMLYLYYGARLNQFFEIFNSQLQDLRSVYVDLCSNKEDYFIGDLEPRSFMHKKIVEYIKMNVGTEIHDVNIYLKSIIKTVKDTATTLEFDRRNHPFQLYGITITFNMLKSIFVGLATVIGYALQQRMNTKQQQQ